MQSYASLAKGLLVALVARHIRQVRNLSRRTNSRSTTIARRAANWPLICSLVQCVRSKNLLDSSASYHEERMQSYASLARGLLVALVARHIRQVRILSRRTKLRTTTIVPIAANSLPVLLQDVEDRPAKTITHTIFQNACVVLLGT